MLKVGRHTLTRETIGSVVMWFFFKQKTAYEMRIRDWSSDVCSSGLAAARGIKVIEDCAQAHGARYKGRSVGSIGHVSAWSFCQDKIMTTGGDGGMVTCNDRELWSRMW